VKEYLSLQIPKHVIEFAQVRFEPVKPGLPLPGRFFRGKSQDRKVLASRAVLAQAGEILAKKRDGMLAGHALALIQREYRPQHSLVFGVWLTEVEIWHTPDNRQQTEKL
jgi:hypothetical protein